MKDIDIAKKILIEEDLSIIFVKNGKVIYKSKEKGIKPLYIAVTTKKKEIENCCVADKIIGNAAARLYALSNVKELYTNVITKSGKKLLNEKDIKITYDTCVKYIKNRKKNDMCPVEKLSQNKIESKELLDGIKEFLLNNNLIMNEKMVS